MKYKINIILLIIIFVLLLLIVINSRNKNLDNGIMLPDIVVKGDVSGNGEVETEDYILIRKHILKMPELTGDKLARADVDGKGGVTASDYIIVRKIILGLYKSEPTASATATSSTIAVTSVSLNKNSAALTVDESITLTETVSPSNATNKKVIWLSSDNSIVSVSNGIIKGLKPGTATITVKTDDGGKTATCNVTVYAKEVAKHEVTIVGTSIIETDLPKEFVLSGKEAVPTVRSKNVFLKTNTQYVLSFDYQTTGNNNNFSADLFPDNLPQINLTATGQLQHYDWLVSSDISNIGNCKVRFFDDAQESQERDITISNVIFGEAKKSTYNDGTKLGTLPSPKRVGYSFTGWYTSPTGGTRVTSDTIVTSNMTLYPHWAKSNAKYNTSGFPYSYEDETAKLTIEKKVYNSTITNKSTVYYQAHLILSDYSRIRTAVANLSNKKSDGKYAGGRISNAARSQGAIFAIEGDYAVNGRGDKNCGLKGSIRDGELITPNNIDLASLSTSSVGYGYYSKKTGVFGYGKSLKTGNLKTAVDSGEITDSICFKPVLVVNGVNKNTSDASKTNRPRQATFIGYVKPGEYYFIVSEGLAYSNADKPSDGTSYGLTIYEKGELLRSLGCTYGTSMDGGGSIIVYFMGMQLQSRKVINDERNYLLDYLYFK